jgi:hypothetical protein
MSHPSLRSWAGGLTVVALLSVIQYVLPAAAASQQQSAATPTPDALLQGVVVYASTGQAVESAVVSVVGTDLRMETGRYGAFAFSDLQPGIMAIRVTAEGHPSVTEEINFTGEGIVFLQFRLPSIEAVLAELLVGVTPGNNTIDGRTAADLLSAKVPSLGRPTSGNVGLVGDGVVLQLRSAPNGLVENMGPVVYIDGVRISGGETALEVLGKIPASDVVDIEVLRGPLAAFLYPLASSGVVLVTTTHGRR